MLAEYVYSCALEGAVIHIGSGYVVILIEWVFQNLKQRLIVMDCVFVL